ncbi:ATP-binding cassette domain-containing protein [Pseudonocardia sp. NPDC049635]|uniref:ATP-binding cassette domain-containing protein n=1 Tax=Pseudonocardia sp. NPDC049635 TaxID=3155506 RepID=UPI00340D33C8
MPTLSFRSAGARYPNGTVAVADLTFQVRGGELLALLGPPRSGKSTVLRLASGELPPMSGSVLIDGTACARFRARNRPAALVDARPGTARGRTVAEHIGRPMQIAGAGTWTRTCHIAELAERLHVGELLPHPLDDLSVGQRRRVAFATALARRPRLLLLDEPLAGVDEETESVLREVLRQFRAEGRTILYATSHPAEANELADRVAVLHGGRLRDLGTPRELGTRPGTVHGAVAMADPPMNLLEASVHAQQDRHVVLTIGRQNHWLPWSDLRSRSIAHYHGERVVLGVRPDAVAPGGSGVVLRGVVRGVEHRSDGAFALLDIGAGGVDPHREEILAPLDRPARRATFRVPLPAHDHPSVGRPMAVGFGAEALHAFDRHGRRIDVMTSARTPVHAHRG